MAVLELEENLKTQNIDFYNKYNKLCDELNSKIYPSIDLSLAQDNGIYTRHGKEHFDKVVEIAGKLIKDNYNDYLNEFELFFLLSAIRLHDIGNVMSRVEHEKNVLSCLKKFGVNHELGHTNLKICSDISQAHSGRASDGDKDTIKDLTDKHKHSDNVFIRMQLLASILKFADELDEGIHRTYENLLENNVIKEENKIYHVYSACVDETKILLNDGVIEINFYIKNEYNNKYKVNQDEKIAIKIFDTIKERLVKLEKERRYYMRYNCQHPIKKIKSIITVIDQNGKYEEIHSIVSEENGYPNFEINNLNIVDKVTK